MASNTLGAFRREPGFCSDCGSVLPSLGQTGKVECYTCHLKHDFTSSVDKAVDPGLKRQQEDEPEVTNGEKWGLVCEPSIMDGNSPLVNSPMCGDHSDMEKTTWTPLESKKFISGIQDKIVYAEDRFKHLAQQLYYSRDVIMQARGGGVEQDGKMSCIQSEITPSQQSTKQAQKNNTSKKSQFELTINDGDGIQSSHDLHYPSSGISSSSNFVLPTTSHHSQLDITYDNDVHWMAKPSFEDFSDSVSDITEFFNTAAEGLFTEPAESAVVGLPPTDFENQQHDEIREAVAHTAQLASKSMPNGQSDIAKTNSKAKIVSCKNHNSVAITSSLLTEKERSKNIVNEAPSHAINDDSKGDLACYTDKGCFSIIASRSPSPEDKKNIESSGQVKKSCQNGVSKVTKQFNKSNNGNISRVKLNLTNNLQSNLTENGNKLDFDTNIVKLSHDADDQDLIELSLCPQSTLNKKNSKDGINSDSKVRRVSSRFGEIDNNLKRSKSALNITSKMTARVSSTKGEVNLGQKKDKSLVDRPATLKVGRISNSTGDQSVNITSKIHSSQLARKASSNNEISLTKKSSKINMAPDNTTKVAKISSPKCEIEVRKKRSKHTFADSSNVVKKFRPNGELELTNKRNKHANTSNMVKKTSPEIGTDVAKKWSRHTFVETYKVPKKSIPNVEGGITIQRSRINVVNTPRMSSPRGKTEATKKISKSYIANFSNVARKSCPSYEMEMIKKSSKTTFESNIKRNNSNTAYPMQKKTKPLSPYAQLINKKVISQEKPKSSNPYSQLNGIKKLSKTTIASKSSVKPKPLTACSPTHICAKKQVPNRKVSQLNCPKKGSKNTIDFRLHKPKPSKLNLQLEIPTKESRDSIISKYKNKRTHTKSQHHLKKHKTTSKCKFGDLQLETIQENLIACGESKYSRNNKMGDVFNETSENKCLGETPDKLMEKETKTTSIKRIGCFQGNKGTSKVFGNLSHSFYHNHSHILYQSHVKEDMPQDKYMRIGNDQSIVEATPLTGNISRLASTISKYQRIECNKTTIFLQKHYETPTISSQQKRVMKSPFINMKRKVIPFIIARSTMPSHNINVQIQDVISLIRTKPFKSGMPNISNFLRPIQKTPLTAMTSVPLDPAHYSLVTMYTSQQHPHQPESESINILSPSTQLVSISQSCSKCNGWKQLSTKRLSTKRHLEEVPTPQKDVRQHCCCHPLQKQSNYQDVLNNYIKIPQNVATSKEKELLMTSRLDETSIIETDGMRARRLLSEIIGYISGDFQQITQNLEKNSLEQVVNEQEMASLRVKVEQNTAIVDETMKILEEGKELQSKYRRLAHAVTQDIMFDSHPSIMPTLREPPLSSRLRSLMLKIKNFKKELALE